VPRNTLQDREATFLLAETTDSLEVCRRIEASRKIRAAPFIASNWEDVEDEDEGTWRHNLDQLHDHNDRFRESCVLAGYIERCVVLHGTSSEAARGSIRLSTLAHTVLAATTEAVTANQAEELQHG
jgi:hypothetical protein